MDILRNNLFQSSTKLASLRKGRLSRHFYFYSGIFALLVMEVDPKSIFEGVVGFFDDHCIDETRVFAFEHI